MSMTSFKKNVWTITQYVDKWKFNEWVFLQSSFSITTYAVGWMANLTTNYIGESYLKALRLLDNIILCHWYGEC